MHSMCMCGKLEIGDTRVNFRFIFDQAPILLILFNFDPSMDK